MGAKASRAEIAEICYAALDGNLEQVRYCVEEKGISVNVKDEHGYTPLYDAARKGHLSVVEYLCEKTAVDVNAMNDIHGYTPLHRAAINGHLSIVEYLCEKTGADVNARTDDGDTPLHWAVSYGHLSIVEYLCEKTAADVNAMNKHESTPLHVAAINGHLSVVEYLCEKTAADVNTKNKDGVTPLHMAANKGDLSVVEYLCEKRGADVNAKRIDGSTPLHLVGQYKYLDKSADIPGIAVVLLKHGGDLNIQNNKGETAYHRLSSRFKGQQFLSIIERIIHECPQTLPQDGKGLSLSPEQWNLALQRIPITNCKLFLLGDGGGGKTSLRKALAGIRDPNDPLEHEDDPDNPSLRTLGVEYDMIELRHDNMTVPICIQDHGGQREFHIIHDMFFQAAYAVYVVVVRIDRNDPDEVKQQLRYWLRFMCSSVSSGGQLLIVLSGYSPTEDKKRLIWEYTKMAEGICNQFAAALSERSLVLESQIYVMDCRKSGSADMQNLRGWLVDKFSTMQSAQHLTMPSACVKLQSYVQQVNNRPGGDYIVRVDVFWQQFCLQVPQFGFLSQELFLKLCEYLQQCGDILVLDHQWLVLSPNVFTNQLVGRLFTPFALNKLNISHRHCLTSADIEKLTNGSSFFGDEETMPGVLEMLGLCIRINAVNNNDGHDGQDTYFPSFIQADFPSPPSLCPRELQYANNMGYRFQLDDNEHQMFCTGFFPRLFAELYSASKLNAGSLAPMLWRDAILLHQRVYGADCYLLVECHPDRDVGMFDVLLFSDMNARLISQTDGNEVDWLEVAISVIERFISRTSTLAVTKHPLVDERNFVWIRDRQLKPLHESPPTTEPGGTDELDDALKLCVGTNFSADSVNSFHDAILRHQICIQDEISRDVSSHTNLRQLQQDYAHHRDNFSRAYRTVFEESQGEAGYDALVACVERQCELLHSSATANDNVVQRSTALIKLYQEAITVIRPFRSIVGTIAHENRGTLLAAPLKRPHRALEKMCIGKHNNDASHLLDIVRAMITFKSSVDMLAGFNALVQCSDIVIVRVKNRLSTPTDAGWADILMNVRLRDDVLNQHICEIQLAYENMYYLRRGGAHKSYAKLRRPRECFEYLGLDINDDDIAIDDADEIPLLHGHDEAQG